jgi:hypothetical protein
LEVVANPLRGFTSVVYAKRKLHDYVHSLYPVWSFAAKPGFLRNKKCAQMTELQSMLGLDNGGAFRMAWESQKKLKNNS